jgi:hypothetical protein
MMKLSAIAPQPDSAGDRGSGKRPGDFLAGIVFRVMAFERRP